MDAELRKMTQNDIDGVVELEMQSFHTPWGREIIEPCMVDDKYDYYVLCNGDAVIGYFCTYSFLDTSEIFRIAVDEKHRKKGFAEIMMKQIILVAKEKGAERILLEVRSSNIPAINLYEKFGFIQYGKRAKYYGGKEDAVLYSLDLGGV